jgi:hypothetical protein
VIGSQKPMELSEADYRLLLARSWKVREVPQVFAVPTSELHFVTARGLAHDSLLAHPALSEKGSPTE